jgi:hypothetical protein
MPYHLLMVQVSVDSLAPRVKSAEGCLREATVPVLSQMEN